VQVEGHRRVVIVGFEHEQLRARALGELAVDRAGEHDPALVEQAPEELVFGGRDRLQLHGCRS
jgi:hypothetical protein